MARARSSTAGHWLGTHFSLTSTEIVAFFPYLWKREERRGGEEEKGEKRREKEKGKRKDYEVMGRAPAAF